MCFAIKSTINNQLLLLALCIFVVLAICKEYSKKALKYMFLLKKKLKNIHMLKAKTDQKNLNKL